MARLLISIFCFLPLFVSDCRIDHGLDLLESRITGKIVFIGKREKPDFVESLRVVAAVKLPPESLGDVVFTYTSVNLSKEQPNYEIPAPIASYEMVAVIWKQKGKTWDYANILGFYGFDPINLKFEYIKVVLTKEHPVAESIDIYCDWSLARPR